MGLLQSLHLFGERGPIQLGDPCDEALELAPAGERKSAMVPSCVFAVALSSIERSDDPWEVLQRVLYRRGRSARRSRLLANELAAVAQRNAIGESLRAAIIFESRALREHNLNVGGPGGSLEALDVARVDSTDASPRATKIMSLARSDVRRAGAVRRSRS